MPSSRILVVDDEPDIREMISDILDDEGYGVLLAGDGGEAREMKSQEDPDLILLDVWMPDTDGISLLKEWREADTLSCPVVMISGHGTVETAVEATRLGAYDFIEKPISLAKLLVTVANGLEAGRLKRENEGLRQQLPPVLEPIGKSQAVQSLRRRLERIAAHEASVLIHGEAGVGKEQTARWIHAHGERSASPFLIAGTRTDAGGWQVLLHGDADTPGLLREVGDGVLYIDDVSRLDADSQKLLLGVLESGRIQPQVSDSPPLAARIIAGTSRPLEQMVREEAFDEALFYQLNVLPLEVPPLRERREDVLPLAEHFAMRMTRELERELFAGFSAAVIDAMRSHAWIAAGLESGWDHIAVRPDGDLALPRVAEVMAALNRLRNYHWPGNLRELRNLVQRLLVLGRDDEISLEEVEEALAQSDTGVPESEPVVPEMFTMPLREAREAFEREYLTHQLKVVEGSVGKLAEVVGMERTHLYRKLRQLGVDPKQAAREGD